MSVGVLWKDNAASSGATIRDCYFHDLTVGIDASTSLGQLDVSGCRFDLNGTDIWVRQAFDVAKITNCEFTRSTTCIDSITGGTGPTQGLIVTGCHFGESPTTCIDLYAQYAIISDCYFQDAVDGIRHNVATSDFFAYAATIKGNVFDSVDNAIALKNSFAGSIPTHFQIVDNLLDGCGAIATSPGIDIQRWSYGRISGNTIILQIGAGIVLDNLSDVDVADNLIQNAGTMTAIDAITCTSVTDSTIRNNTVTPSGANSYDYGVSLDAFSNGNHVAGNIIRSPITGQVEDLGANTQMGRTNRGVAALSGASLAVTHNLGLAPTVVMLTPEGNQTVWVSGITSTQFTVNQSGAGALNVHWLAIL